VANDWNDIGVIADVNTLRRMLGSGSPQGSQAVEMNGFGAIALTPAARARPATATCPTWTSA
jgi:hypothetical protein